MILLALFLGIFIGWCAGRLMPTVSDMVSTTMQPVRFLRLWRTGQYSARVAWILSRKRTWE